MGTEYLSETEIVRLAEHAYGVGFRLVSGTEYRSVNGCPKCGDGGKGSHSDRFRLFADDHALVWCRRCGFSEFVDKLDPDRRPTSQDIQERRLRAVEQQQAEHARRLSALEVMHASTDHLRYWHNMEIHTDAIAYWDAQGMSLQTIDDYKLGYCPRCPTDHEGRPSYTIPVLAYGKLWNIRHRLIGADDGDKYRPHLAGLPAMLFNADNLQGDPEHILIVEGEKKSIIAAQTGFPNVGLMGKSGFKAEWAGKFARFQTVFVALDPDAEAQAVEIARLFKGRGRLVLLPGKLDDLLTQYGATAEDIEWFLRRARRV